MIAVENLQKTLPLNVRSIENVVAKILKARRIKDADLTFVFVSRQKISALNRRFLRRGYATDVLAFDLSAEPGVLRGDIIISADAVVKQARLFGQSASRELMLYMIHGVLHLLGFDDHSPEDIAAMRKEELRILNLIGDEAGILKSR